jgi:ferric-dicitrate binding protein FerR (iron transport regulator)
VRGLELEGAARFVVAANREPAFQVRARGAAVVATGTDFVVRAWDDDPVLYVLVREGSVRLHPVAGQRGAHTLRAGDAVSLAPDGTLQELDTSARAHAFAWVDGVLQLDRVTVAEALRLMARWHGLQPTLAEPALGERVVTTTLVLDSDATALDSLVRAAGLVSTYEGATLVLRDSVSAARP